MALTLQIPIPPDAGRSYLGQFGIGSPWVVWLLKQEAALLAETPAALKKPNTSRVCPAALDSPPHRMVYRPGAWKCYLHDEPVIVLIRPKVERAPKVDVLSRIGEMLDWRYDEHTRRYTVVAFEVR